MSSQTLVLDRINALRRTFHLPSALPTTLYNSVVTSAATSERDPHLPALFGKAVEEFGVWGIAPYQPAPSNVPATAILNNWVYRDGWLGKATTNEDCTFPTASGCNSHRRAILSLVPAGVATLYADIAVTKSDYEGGPGTSIAILLVWMRP